MNSWDGFRVPRLYLLRLRQGFFPHLLADVVHVQLKVRLNLPFHRTNNHVS
jgi:hypothetical protein